VNPVVVDVETRETNKSKKGKTSSKNDFGDDCAVSSMINSLMTSPGAAKDAKRSAQSAVDIVEISDRPIQFAEITQEVQRIIDAVYREKHSWTDVTVYNKCWPVLRKAGWRKDYISGRVGEDTWVFYYLPPWNDVPKVTKDWLEANAHRKNRDYFDTMASLLKYLDKYGISGEPAPSKATPIKYSTTMSRREVVTTEESFTDYYTKKMEIVEAAAVLADKEAKSTRKKDLAVKKAADEVVAKKAKLASPVKSRKMVMDGPIIPEIIPDLRDVFDEYATSRSFYIFPRLWCILAERGWKSFKVVNAFGMDNVVFCPPLSPVTEDDCHELETTGFVMNKDYFDDKEHFQIFIHQQCFPEDGLPELPQQSRKRFAYKFEDYFDKFHKVHKARPSLALQKAPSVRNDAAVAAFVDSDDDSLSDVDFEPEWQALLMAATQKRNKLDLSNFEDVWKICFTTSGGGYSHIRLNKTTYYCRQMTDIRSLADVAKYEKNVHYFTSKADFLDFVHRWGTEHGCDVDMLIAAAAMDASDHMSESSNDSSDSSMVADSNDGLELSYCWPQKSLQGTRKLSHEHHYDALADSICGNGTPLIKGKLAGTKLDLAISPISDLSDNDTEFEDPLVAMLQQPHIPFARIFEYLQQLTPPWTWINRSIPSELCNQEIPVGVEAIYFKPGMHLRSEGMKRGEDFFCREAECVDYLRAANGIQEGKQYESESKKARKTRSGKTLVPDRLPAEHKATEKNSSSAASSSSSSSSRDKMVVEDDNNSVTQKKRKLSSVPKSSPSKASKTKPKTCEDFVNAAFEALKPGAVTAIGDGTRETEMNLLSDIISSCVQVQAGGSVYVCGSPGLGKSLTVKNVLDNVLSSSDFSCHVNRIEFQGTSLKSDSMWKVIAEQLGLLSSNNAEAKQTLLARFRSPVTNVSSGQKSRRIVPLTVLLVDEIDRAPKEEIRELMTISGSKDAPSSNASLCFSPSGSFVNNSSLLLVSIANSMTFPIDMGLPSSSRPVTISFQPYDNNGIASILQQRTQGLFEPKAMEYVAKSISKEGGDMRMGMEVAINSLRYELDKRGETDAVALRELLAGPSTPIVSLKTVLAVLSKNGFGPGAKLAGIYSALSEATKMCLIAVVVGGMDQDNVFYDPKILLKLHNEYLASRSLPEVTIREVLSYVGELTNSGLLEGGQSGFGGARRAQIREEVRWSRKHSLLPVVIFWF
jgi:Cdc6-like AAA superfamily ATPase